MDLDNPSTDPDADYPSKDPDPDYPSTDPDPGWEPFSLISEFMISCDIYAA